VATITINPPLIPALTGPVKTVLLPSPIPVILNNLTETVGETVPGTTPGVGLKTGSLLVTI
jgi:hypothetical protein